MRRADRAGAKTLAAIQRVTQRTRHSLARSGPYIFLIVTGVVWLAGFQATRFLSGADCGAAKPGTSTC
jgi:hypothetical protein